MSKRITLSIPDKLHQQLENWRNSFNLSRVFQDALAEVIRRKESMQERLKDDLPQVIARLKREKQEAEGNWFQEGVNAGLLWARNAHWLDLKRILTERIDTVTSSESGLQDYFREVLKTEERKLALNDGIEEFRTTFLEGWMKGVRDFWTMVNDKI